MLEFLVVKTDLVTTRIHLPWACTDHLVERIKCEVTLERYAILGNGGLAPPILILSARRRRVVIFTAQLPHLQGKGLHCPLDTSLGGHLNRLKIQGNEKLSCSFFCLWTVHFQYGRQK